MKIESGSNTTLASLQNGTQRASGNGAKTAIDGVSQVGDAKKSTVSLSTLSTDMRTNNSSDIDTAKVESIKAALRDGTYTPDSSKIADGMLSTARDMMQTRTQPTGG